MRRSPLPVYSVIENRVSVHHAGEIYMYCYRDGDEEAITQRVKDDVSQGKLHPFAGGMLCYLIRFDEAEETE